MTDNNPSDFRAAYFGRDSLYVVKVDGRQDYAVAQLTDLGNSICWIPNTSSFLYSEVSYNNTASLRRFNCSTGSNTVLLTISNGAFYTIIVSPDGERFLSLIVKNGEKEYSIYDIRGNLLNIVPDVAKNTSITSWSNDSRSLLLTVVDSMNANSSSLWSYRPEDSKRTLLSDTSFRYSSASYSPDGTMICARIVNSTGNSGIVLMNADGTGVRTGVPFDFSILDPVWSPDGKNIAFLKSSPIYTKLSVLDCETMTVKQVSDEPGVHFEPRWIDNDRIAFFSNGEMDLLSVTKEGNRFTQVTDIDPLQSSGNFVYAISRIPF